MRNATKLAIEEPLIKSLLMFWSKKNSHFLRELITKQ